MSRIQFKSFTTSVSWANMPLAVSKNGAGSDSDDWDSEEDGDYVNEMTEEEQRYGRKRPTAAASNMSMDSIRSKAVTQNEELNKKKVSDSSGAYNVSRGYGGKFGVEKDRMDSGAVGHDYHAALNKHASQKDYATGFGGKYGVQAQSQDKVREEGCGLCVPRRSVQIGS